MSLLPPKPKPNGQDQGVSSPTNIGLQYYQPAQRTRVREANEHYL
ncbi:hypothetical protein GBAR_LOCUS8812, partial [Geodia barretti]